MRGTHFPWRSALFVAACLVLAGCDQTPISGVQDQADAAMAGTKGDHAGRAESILSQPNRFPRGVEDEFLRLETELPGFGGFYIGDNGDFVAVSTGAVSDEIVSTRMVEFIRVNSTRFVKPGGSLPQVTVVSGEYAFSRLLDYLFAVRERITQEHDVILLDADEQRNRLRIGIGPKGSLESINRLARSIGVDTAALYTELMSSYPRTTQADLRDKYRSTFAGIQTQQDHGLAYTV